MNKGLEALRLLKTLAKIDSDKDIIENIEINYTIIEKLLKALDIIKNKQVDVGWFIKCYNDYSNDEDRLMMYNQLSIDDKGRDLTQEEYDLIKEVLLLD